MTQQELRLIGSKLGINCGGEGGTPGPCKSTGKSAQAKSTAANDFSRSLGDGGSKKDHLKASDLHEAAATEYESLLKQKSSGPSAYERQSMASDTRYVSRMHKHTQLADRHLRMAEHA